MQGDQQLHTTSKYLDHDGFYMDIASKVKITIQILTITIQYVFTLSLNGS